VSGPTHFADLTSPVTIFAATETQKALPEPEKKRRSIGSAFH